MRITGKTHIGMVRTTNQDSYRTGDLNENTVWAVVCDGMGGASGGDVASSMAVDIISQKIVSGYNVNMKASSISNLLEAAINLANIKIYDTSVEKTDLNGMGTTVVAVIVRDNEVFISHAGDSRAYIIKDDEIGQITTDHSVVQEMVDRGEITSQQAKTHPIKNYITRALGVSEHIDVDFSVVSFNENDTLLVCTDGLSNYVEPDIMVKAIKRYSDNYEKLPDALIDSANLNGGKDNITVVIVSH